MLFSLKNMFSLMIKNVHISFQPVKFKKPHKKKIKNVNDYEDGFQRSQDMAFREAIIMETLFNVFLFSKYTIVNLSCLR